MIIGSAAHFKLCPCGLHGRLYSADGTATVNLCSKEDALTALDAGVEKGLITKDEVPEARRQIMTSDLPRYKDEITLIGTVAAVANDICVKGLELNDEHFHQSSRSIH